MRILLSDSWKGKFSSAIKEHWESLGYTVLFNGEFDGPVDLAFFYNADNTTIEGVKKSIATRNIVQAVDIEVWQGQANAIDWSKVDGAIFMAQHIKDMVPVPCRYAIIKPGIDLTKFTLASPNRFTDPTRRIAYVVGDNRIWDVKRFDIALQLLYDVRKLKPEFIWQLHVRGTYSTHAQYNAYCKHLIKELGIEDFIIWSDRVDDMNLWLEDKHYFVLPSTKEVFSYATAEAMAKGIKPVISNWQSARDNWGEYVNNSYMEMLERLVEDKYESEVYRKYIVDNFNQERYFKELDSFLGLG